MLHHSVRKAAEKTPHKVAFRCMQESLTYQELLSRSTRLAYVLRELGIAHGDRVGIFLNRCLDSPAAVYGILEAGAAFVPLDPFAPASRNAFVLDDCGIKVVISNNSQRRQLAGLLKEAPDLNALVGTALNLSVPQHLVPNQAPLDSTSASRTDPHDLAYIMYTSGTTGTPKGIMHTHFSGLSYAQLSADVYGVRSEDRIGNHSPLHFDISTFAYFTGPLCGATTVLSTDAHTKLPSSLAQMIEDEKLTIWYSVPLALTQILQRGNLAERNWDNLRWVLYGGEPFPVKHLQTLMQHTPKATWSNVYGPAEVNQCTYHHLSSPPIGDTPIPLGQIWDRTKALVLNSKDQTVDQGEQGELLIHSDTMMQGYWKRPDLTERAFYHDASALKYYRTGDLVHTDEEGRLHFDGRKDRQIKTRGYRVELDEVEAALITCIDLTEAAVFAIKQDGETILVAAIVSSSTEELYEQMVIQHLKKLVPPYSIPARFVRMDKLPRTPAGKVDHQSLIENEKRVK